MTLVKRLIELVIDQNEIENSVSGVNNVVIATYKECCKTCFQEIANENVDLKINSVADYLHDELHTGPWNTVALNFRRGFTGASFIKAVASLKAKNKYLSDILKSLDLGILLGAPLENNPNLLTNSARCISEELSKTFVHHPNYTCTEVDTVKPKKRKINPTHIKYKDINGIEIDKISIPSIEHFLNKYFTPEKPLKIKDAMNHWPACDKWININYLLNLAGDRTVPIEIGSQYSDENWSQKLMTVKDFVQNYFFGDNETIGYLAQHNLLDQVPELRDDICIPDYCCVSRNVSETNSDPEINAWFGPRGTVSSLHFDPKDNILAQVFGTKQVIMFSPSDSDCLYPHNSHLLSNTAQVDPVKPDLTKYPKFKDGVMFKCLLDAGEMLYIPPKWWHHITAIEKSFSVNFWWT